MLTLGQKGYMAWSRGVIEWRQKQMLTLGQNGDIPLSNKTYSKMSMFWNYLEKCSCFKLYFLKIDFHWKTKFLENRVIGNQT